ncbi:MAG: Phosphate transport regulator (distant homolog of PhoU), partial [uncultured Solirubrobacteraceae bacterium]
GAPVPDLRPQGTRVLRPVRGGGLERRARRRAPRPHAARVARVGAAGARGAARRAGGRPHHARHHPPAQPDLRDAAGPRGHHRAGLRARRHRRLHGGGRGLPRPLPHRGADGPVAAARGRAGTGLPPGGPGAAAAAHARRHLPLHRRDPPPRERRRPDRARGARLAVRARDRPDDGDPLEGHLRAPRGGDRRHRDGGERPAEHRDQERL